MGASPTRLNVSLRHRGFRRCESHKVGYPTYEKALDVAETMMDQGLVRPGCHITPYLCSDCGEWHVYNRVIVPVP